MSLKKIVIIGSVTLFSFILVSALVKRKNEIKGTMVREAKSQTEQEIIVVEKPVVKEAPVVKAPAIQIKKSVKQLAKKNIKEQIQKTAEVSLAEEDFPQIDNIDRLFVTDSSKMPLVETVTYTSRVPWLMDRPAWIADYASHYKTTRHFIARSLNKKTDYITQKVSPGDRFNVLKKDVEFHLLIDLSRSKMLFYGIDTASNKRYLLKTYVVGLGRKDSKKESKCLTPAGKYLLGSKVAIYKPGIMGYFQDRQIEMIRVFGTRWIPFEKEVADSCSDGAKGYGIHGAPWYNDSQTGNLIESREKVGKYESDGCIRCYSEDIEEIFSIIISKKTTIELVNNFKEAKFSEMEEVLK